MTRIFGAESVRLDTSACLRIVQWFEDGRRGRLPLPPRNSTSATAYPYLLAHTDDGVIWGRTNERGHWLLCGEAIRDLDPPLPGIQAAIMQQLRLFGPTEELLIWRVENPHLPGRFLGRILRDQDCASLEDWQQPKKSPPYVLLGDRVLAPSTDGFTLIGDAAGSRHAPPVELKGEGDKRLIPDAHRPVLEMIHYFAEADDNGCVRIVATRLSGFGTWGSTKTRG